MGLFVCGLMGIYRAGTNLSRASPASLQIQRSCITCTFLLIVNSLLIPARNMLALLYY